MEFILSNIKIFYVIFGLTLVVAILLASIGNYFEPRIVQMYDRDVIGYYFKIIYFVFFLILGYSAFPIIISLVVVVLTKLPAYFSWYPEWAKYIVSIIDNYKHHIVSIFTYSAWILSTGSLIYIFKIMGNIFKKF